MLIEFNARYPFFVGYYYAYLSIGFYDDCDCLLKKFRRYSLCFVKYLTELV